MRNKGRKGLLLLLIPAAIVLIAAVLSAVRFYSDRVSRQVFESSTASLTEVYTQVRNSFVLTTNEQWSKLSLAADCIEEAGSNERDIPALVAGWNEEWRFNEFFFLNADGAYCTADGQKGIVDLGTSWRSLFRRRERIAIDGSIPGREAMMFFAVPTAEGSYRGFGYSAIAIAYDMATLDRELGVSAFEGRSSCYILAGNGRVVLANENAEDVNGNLLFHMKSSSLTEQELADFRQSLEQGGSGSFKYTCHGCGRGYYLFYTPIGIGGWELVAVVPSAMVDEYATAIQGSITYMLLAVFGAFLLVVIIAAVLMNRRIAREKNQKIRQQNVLFRQMSEHMNDIFVLYDTKRKRLEYISPNTERILGIPHEAAQARHSGISDAFEQPERLAELIASIDGLAPGAASNTTESFVNRTTGQEYVFRVSMIRDAEDPALVSIIFSDRTREREARRQIEDALMVAEHANRAKTTFLNNMSHDIRTPMNAIIGFTSLAVTHIEEKQLVRDYLSKIMVSSEHLLSLINDVLDMSRIESGKIKIDEKEVTLPDIMHDLRNILQTDIKAKRLDFYIDTVDIVHESILCDKLRLNQILINLMSNAMKFTQPGGTVGIRVVEKAGAPEGYADYEFHVKDTGIGMSEEFAAHIFEPFTREENSTVSRIQGTGLGMAITKNIVDLMDGRIAVKTRKGEGTEFIVSLRFRTGESRQEIRVIKKLEGFRALVADDSMDSCSSVTGMLRTIGMRPEWTTSGKEAVYRATVALKEGDPFHVYIIDWLMPDMNGVEVVRRIRGEIGSTTPIIILTAYDWSAIEAEAREAGVTAFCAKPLFMSELYSILQNEGTIPEAEVVEAPEPDRFRGRRVLLVDDVELNREIAVAILEEAGIEVETAENGREAVDMVERSAGRYDLVLMDVMMPVMDGYEATRTIRALPEDRAANVPIIAMTANAFEEDRRAALDAGMNDHLAKPFRLERLYEMMMRYL